MPKFDGKADTIAKKHMVKFQDFLDNLFIEYDDVYTRVFVQTLEGEVRKRFRYFIVYYLNSWPTLEQVFLRQWDKRGTICIISHRFLVCKRRMKKLLVSLIKRFNKIYNKILHDIKPSQATA